MEKTFKCHYCQRPLQELSNRGVDFVFILIKGTGRWVCARCLNWTLPQEQKRYLREKIGDELFEYLEKRERETQNCQKIKR